jgi:hypothetical protein
MFKRILHFGYGLAAYLVFGVTFLVALAFVGGCPLLPTQSWRAAGSRNG